MHNFERQGMKFFLHQGGRVVAVAARAGIFVAVWWGPCDAWAATKTAQSARAQSAREKAWLTIEALVDFKHPSLPTWSPDGSWIAFIWDRAGVENVWVISASDARPRALTRFQTGLLSGLFWSSNGGSLFFEQEGDLWRISAGGGGEPERVWQTKEVESSVVLSPDGEQVAFERNGDLWTRSLGSGREIRLTETAAAEYEPVWSPDSARLAFTFASVVMRQDSPEYAGAKIAFKSTDYMPSDVGVVSSSGGKVVPIAASPGEESTPGWIDGTRLTLQRVSEDRKTREILVADARTGEGQVLHRDVDEKWWSMDFLGPGPAPSPDGRWIAFLSDRDGWDHLYVISPSGGPLHQVTSGQQDVSRLAWSPEGRRIAFDTNQGDHPGRRHLAVAEIGPDPSKARIRTLTAGRGTNIQPADRYGFLLARRFGGWSPDGRRLVYQHTDPRNPADLFWTDVNSSPGQPRRLTQSFPETVDRAALVEPDLVRYASSDGQQVPAYLFVPRALDRSRKHAAIVWIHGDGIAQNYDGWHIRRDYAVYDSFHQYLVQKGYIVLAVDYRGSIGYGKAWRQGHFRDLGGMDYQDIAAGVSYLQKLGFVDPERVGVWGLSYGGFMTLQALTVTPELFRCGINVAGVADWRNWNRDPDGPWIRGRMGRAEENPDLYRNASPIERLDRIARPLLVLHGTADVNVPFLESVALIDKLTRLGKGFDFMMYPGEFHYFHRAHVLRDAWQRVERFFDSHLKLKQ